MPPVISHLDAVLREAAGCMQDLYRCRPDAYGGSSTRVFGNNHTGSTDAGTSAFGAVNT